MGPPVAEDLEFNGHPEFPDPVDGIEWTFWRPYALSGLRNALQDPGGSGSSGSGGSGSSVGIPRAG